MSENTDPDSTEDQENTDDSNTDWMFPNNEPGEEIGPLYNEYD